MISTDELYKEVLNSNLSDDAKIEIMKVLVSGKDVPYQPPYQIQQPYIIKYVPAEENKKIPWEITCDSDAGWWRQQMENAIADCVTSSPFHY